MFTKIARHVVSWDEYLEFGLYLNLDINFIEQTQNEKDASLRNCTFKLLRAFWSGSREPSSQKWTTICKAIEGINKHNIIPQLGLDKLCKEGPSQATLQAPVDHEPPQQTTSRPHRQVSQDSEMQEPQPKRPILDPVEKGRGFVPVHPSYRQPNGE